MLGSAVTIISVVACLALSGCHSRGEARSQFVKGHLAHSSVSLTYRASAADAKRNVRDFNVTLFSGPVLREPLPHYADGTPAAFAAVVGPAGIGAVADELAADGFFDHSTRWHSEWLAEPTVAPPADSRPYDPSLYVERYPEGALEVRLVVSHDQWHHNFQHAYPLTYDTRELLLRIAARVGPEGRDAIELGLLGKMR